jgi:hypothetical protein
MHRNRRSSVEREVNVSVIFWYFQAFLTPVVAVVAVYIAWQQYKTNRLKIRSDLFERRLKVFLKVRSVLSSVIPEGRANKEEFLKFRTAVAEAYFIFGQEIEDYLDEVYRHGIALATADEMSRTPREQRSDDYDVKQVAADKDAELGWLMAQLPVVKAKLKKYLDVSKL